MSAIRSPLVTLFVSREALIAAIGYDPKGDRLHVRLGLHGDFVSCRALVANGKIRGTGKSGVVVIENAVLEDASTVPSQPGLEF